MHVARPMCMRMSVRLRGYMSTSSHPAFMHEHVGTAAAGGGRVVFNCKSGAPPRCRLACALHNHVGMVGVRPVQSVCSVRCARVAVGVALAPGAQGGKRTSNHRAWSDLRMKENRRPCVTSRLSSYTRLLSISELFRFVRRNG
jgi:hypothetical protein